MKKISKYFGALTIGASLALVGCESDDVPENPDPQTTLNLLDRTAGILVDGGGAYCNATLISPTLVLSSHHCMNMDTNISAENFLTYNLETKTQITTRMTPVSSWLFDRIGTESARGYGDYFSVGVTDKMILGLQNPIANDDFPEILSVKDMAWHSVTIGQTIYEHMNATMVGYTWDSEGKNLATIANTCNLYRLPNKPLAILHDCNTRPGNSGSGFYIWDKDGQGALVGIHRGRFNLRLALEREDANDNRRQNVNGLVQQLSDFMTYDGGNDSEKMAEHYAPYRDLLSLQPLWGAVTPLDDVVAFCASTINGCDIKQAENIGVSGVSSGNDTLCAVVTTPSGLNLRMGAGTEYATNGAAISFNNVVVALANDVKTPQIDSKNQPWAKIKTPDGRVGYISITGNLSKFGKCPV